MAFLTESQQDLGTLINGLIELDYRAVSTYDSAAERIQNPFYRRQLRQFCEDHQHHIIALKPHAGKHNDVVASEPGVTDILTRGRVALANWVGDHAILTALLALEEESASSVNDAVKHPQLDAQLRKTLLKIVGDEANHRAWLLRVLDPDSLAGVPSEA